LSMTNKTFAQSQNSNPNSMLIDTIVSDDATFDTLDSIIVMEYTEGDTLIDLKVLKLENNTIKINAVCYMSDDSLMWDFYSRAYEYEGVSISNMNDPNFSMFFTSYNQLDYNTTGYQWLYTRRDLIVFGDTMTFKVKIKDESKSNYYYINFKIVFTEHTSTSVENHFNSNKKEFSVYPNPFTNELNINGTDGELVRILDMTGKVLMETTDTNIDVSELNSGMYIVNSNGVSKKVVKR